MNDITKKEEKPTIMLPADDDPYAQVANEGGGRFGKILKYVKGEWSHADSPIALGTEFLVLMAEAMQHGVMAGRQAYLAGRMPRRLYATASSPLDGISVPQ